MKVFYSILISLFFWHAGLAQYTFTDDIRLDCSSIKNQQRTGTCWSFATVSLIESELQRLGKGNIDLSEMHIVRNIYADKAMNYIMRQGKANFSQGSLSHDLIRMIDKVGVVPQSVYSGLREGESVYNHSEMESGMKGYLDGISKSKQLSPKWLDGLSAIMDVYMGSCPATFDVDGVTYTPQSYAKHLEINPDAYKSYTSFTHHPFGEEFILEIPDNYSNGAFINIPIEDLKSIVDNALKQGMTVAWDGDVSEKGFSAKEGIAILPTEPDREDLYSKPGKEMKVTQADRQAAFMSYSTTDDHLMHLIGTAKDQKGTKYYIIKNSWGPISPYKGYIYMSESYFMMKTVAIMVHQDGVPQNLMN